MDDGDVESAVNRWSDALHREASTACGELDDFGNGDYRTGLQVLLQAALSSPGAGELLTDRVHNTARSALQARLYAEAAWKAHPGVRDNDLVRPLVITGLPRSGTTVMHQMLANDEQFQFVPQWLSEHPMPRPEPESWPEFEAYRTAVASRSVSGPDLVHDVPPEAPTECIAMLRQSFVSTFWAVNMPLPGYADWFWEQDETASYARYKDVLRLYGTHTTERTWLLKNPSHTIGMRALLRAFPDACVVELRRDPVETISSGASLISRRWPADIWPPEEIGRHRLESWSRAGMRCAEAHADHAESFHVVRYEDLIEDPFAVAQAIYERFDLSMSTRAAATMREWIVQLPQHQHGVHSYTPEKFGLSREGILSAFEGVLESWKLRR
ncbi:MAG TPA: sulfotransferase [Ilumatobacter sp.]|nr:sulfotransferase [Ilumatobacter sp.]